MDYTGCAAISAPTKFRLYHHLVRRAASSCRRQFTVEITCPLGCLGVARGESESADVALYKEPVCDGIRYPAYRADGQNREGLRLPSGSPTGTERKIGNTGGVMAYGRPCPHLANRPLTNP